MGPLKKRIIAHHFFRCYQQISPEKMTNNLRTPDFANLAQVLKTLLIGALGAEFFFSPVERRLGHDPRDQGSDLSCARNLYDLEKVTLLFWILVFLDAESQDS